MHNYRICLDHSLSDIHLRQAVVTLILARLFMSSLCLKTPLPARSLRSSTQGWFVFRMLRMFARYHHLDHSDNVSCGHLKIIYLKTFVILTTFHHKLLFLSKDWFVLACSAIKLDRFTCKVYCLSDIARQYLNMHQATLKSCSDDIKWTVSGSFVCLLLSYLHTHQHYWGYLCCCAGVP